MSDKDNNSDELLIKIPASIFEKKKEDTSSTLQTRNDYSFFERASLAPARVKRNTEHGLTEIQTLMFAEKGQRQKVLDLLDTPPLYTKLPYLLDYLYELGCEPDGEKRYYAAVAVGELATKQPFVKCRPGVYQ